MMTLTGETEDWKTSEDKAGLIRYAKTLGVEVDGRAGIEAIRTAIARKLGETLEALPPDAGESKGDSLGGAGKGHAQNKEVLRGDKRWVCVVHSTERDPFPAYAGVNGVMFVVPRDEERILPESIITVLQKSVMKMMRWSNEYRTNVPVNIPLSPVSKVRMATEEDLADPALNAQAHASAAPRYSM